MERVVILAEPQGEQLASSALELATLGRGLAHSVTAVVFDASGDVTGELGRYGVTEVVDLGTLKPRLPGAAVAKAISELVAEEPCQAVLVAQSYTGRDVLAHLSVLLDVPVLTNAIAVKAEGEQVVVENAIFGGEKIVSSKIDGALALVAVRPKSVAAEPVSSPVEPVVVAKQVEGYDAAKVTASHVEERQGPKLEEADVVVSGGRGLGSPEHYQWVEQLAELLHGATGASRAIVDAGWVPYACQVGQTGKTVKPNLYLAIGISGATQHMVGMKGAKHIIAINRDKDAPILQIADLGVVADAQALVPRLIEAVRARVG